MGGDNTVGQGQHQRHDIVGAGQAGNTLQVGDRQPQAPGRFKINMTRHRAELLDMSGAGR